MEEKANRYHTQDGEFAFFFVNFGTSYTEYIDLSDTQKAFIYKEYENKVISENTFFRNAVLNGVSNALRKKGSKFIELFEVNKPVEEAEIEYLVYSSEILRQQESRGDLSWVDKIYEANGMKKPERG